MFEALLLPQILSKTVRLLHLNFKFNRKWFYRHCSIPHHGNVPDFLLLSVGAPVGALRAPAGALLTDRNYVCHAMITHQICKISIFHLHVLQPMTELGQLGHIQELNMV